MLTTPPEIFLALSPDERWVLDKLMQETKHATPEDAIGFSVWAMASSWKIKVPARAFQIRGISEAPPSQPDQEPPSLCGCGFEGTGAELIIHALVGDCHEAVALREQLREEHGLRALIEPVGVE